MGTPCGKLWFSIFEAKAEKNLRETGQIGCILETLVYNKDRKACLKERKVKKKVLVGMSGGVDSSVAALLLKEQGYDVIGVTMQLWRDEHGAAKGSCGFSAVEDAGKVAETLGIPHYIMDFKDAFKKTVVDYFMEEYLRGHTPNPCVMCNRYIKWEALLKRGRELGADYVATGHYARIDRLPNGRLAIRNCVTAAKDQTYALYQLTQEQLERTLLPIGGYSKEEIRCMAEKAGLSVAGKPDSQEICFVPDDDYAGLIEREKGGSLPGPGNFVNKDGQVLGQHRGIIHYTYGQRRGLDLPMGRRVFVTAIKPETNEVVVGENEDVFTHVVHCDRVNFMAIEDLKEPIRVLAKIRYNHKGDFCIIRKCEDGSVQCEFEKPVRAATPGQAVVFYEGEYVLGGGTIL